MSDQPPEPAYENRAVAEGFGTDAERYERARPAYPDELVERITQESPGPDVLDVGCGTGISSRALLARGFRGEIRTLERVSLGLRDGAWLVCCLVVAVIAVGGDRALGL